ncbi:bifunctional DNA-formamidopyrimidine glycosylase/DNA-(apurinic or apyrimidinic site) lyase [Gammaproteobacteria bacterium]|nr:bifunctional DNA-formamidopyrimidine glycosylase/DNA-(apurinic or apyrimidinic site) lyase [Gammaproteobacteria bacterium]
MPELPEVETTRRGIEPHISGIKVKSVIVRQRQLRWPVPKKLEQELPGEKIKQVLRRGKYLLLITDAGTVMIHLGMSGSLRVAKAADSINKHDHLDIVMMNGKIMRFHDPRKFGSVLWFQENPEEHPLLSALGPEPLADNFTGDYLFGLARKRNVPIKTFIMDSHRVVGVGNIYANEALFAAGIHPERKAGSVSKARYVVLVKEIRRILQEAIKVGGTTLKDFIGGDGKPGYFKQSLHVYGRAGEPCDTCKKTLQEIRLGQRSTVFCRKCQT